MFCVFFFLSALLLFLGFWYYAGEADVLCLSLSRRRQRPYRNVIYTLKHLRKCWRQQRRRRSNDSARARARSLTSTARNRGTILFSAPRRPRSTLGRIITAKRYFTEEQQQFNVVTAVGFCLNQIFTNYVDSSYRAAICL